MMILARLLAPALALWLLAAHFYRAGLWPLALVCALLPLLLVVQSAWAARAVQSALLLGALEWLRTLASIAAVRMAMEQPWLRMAAILLAVATFTALAALVFRSAPLRRRYSLA